MGKGNCVSLFLSQEGNGTADFGIGLSKANWKDTESIDDVKIGLAIKRPSPIFMFILTPVSWS